MLNNEYTENLRKKPINRVLFDIGYTLMMYHNLLVSFSTVKVPLWLQAFMLAAAFLTLFGCILNGRYQKLKTIVMTFSVIIVGVFVLVGTGKMDVIYFGVLLFLTQFVDEKAFLRIDLRNRVVLVLLLLFFSKFGFIPDTMFRKYSSGLVASYAYGGGFNNPNSLGMMFCLIFLEILLLLPKGKRTVVWAGFFFCMMVVCTLFLCGTRTAVLLMILAFTFYVLHSKGFLQTRFWIAYGHLAVVMLAAVSFLLCKGYEQRNSIAVTLNGFLTGRLALCSSFMRKYPATLFGNTVVYYSSTASRALSIPTVVCDNVYIYLLHNLGIVVFWGWLILMTKVSKYLLRNGYSLEFFMMCVVFVYGFMENTMANTMFFPFIVYCSRALFSKVGVQNDVKK